MCTAAQHVLAVPELLRLVFLCIADDELESVAHALRVCKFWWEVGKEILYREVDVENVLCGVQDVAVYPEDTAVSVAPKTHFPHYDWLSFSSITTV